MLDEPDPTQVDPRAVRRAMRRSRAGSFTQRLRDASDPLRAWFAVELPNTEAVARAANHALRGPKHRQSGRLISLEHASLPPLPCRARDHALAGTALELVVRASLRYGGLEHAVGGHGARRLVVGSGVPPAIVLEREALMRIRAMRAWERDLAATGWREVAELCVLLARFDQAGRSRHAAELARMRVTTAPPTLAGYVGALTDADVIDDVTLAAPDLVADHADLRDVEPLRIGPTFALSAQLGGADADLIAGDLLLDFKASSGTRIVGRHELWQLAGYALADTNDELGIRRVGISALRWRRRWTLELEELLASLAGRPIDVAELRADLAAVADGPG